MKSIAIIFLIAGVICFGIGLYKYSVYESHEKSYYSSKNAYVGGDAYNYIINANYFTGWSVLGACFFLSSIVLFATACIKEALDNIHFSQQKQNKCSSSPVTTSSTMNHSILERSKKPEINEKPADNDPDVGDWICSKCGQRNRSYTVRCVNCLEER